MWQCCLVYDTLAKGASTWEFGIVLIGSWTTMPPLSHFQAFLHWSWDWGHQSQFWWHSKGQGTHPRQSWTWWLPPIFLNSTMIIMARFLDYMLFSLGVACANSNTRRTNTKSILSCHFDVLKRPTMWRRQKTELLRWWFEATKNTAVLVTEVQSFKRLCKDLDQDLLLDLFDWMFCCDLL